MVSPGPTAILDDFGIIEVQQNCYQPLSVPRVERWREEAPEDFIFTLKTWQLLTHEPASPTYRRVREQLSDSQLTKVGSCKWSPVTRMAWHRTLALAEALQVDAIMFQTPRSVLPTRANLRRTHRFFEAIDRQGRRMVFKPRGDAWTDKMLHRIISGPALVHAVDAYLRRPVGRGMRYFRLYGRPAYHYRYGYNNADLKALHDMLSRTWPNLVLFNNDNMADDAKRFTRLLNDSA